ncbi:DUF6879 family protein [Pseudonocardia sp. CA-107938]|uniref:DUF6879 family protein n=1 Tax=Pseudonocardia sp. CA-107938 TaxID=3240021 RepID=UPI003D9174E8
MRRDPGPVGSLLPTTVTRRFTTADELDALCAGIESSFVHLETRDSYGTATESPHWAKWRRGEPDDLQWCEPYFRTLRAHRVAGRSCRRLRVVSEPMSEYQQWVGSFVEAFVEAGEDNRYISRQRLIDVLLPASGDFYVFDDALALFLHYAGDGTNTAFEVIDESDIVDSCRRAFETVWKLAVPVAEL